MSGHVKLDRLGIHAGQRPAIPRALTIAVVLSAFSGLIGCGESGSSVLSDTNRMRDSGVAEEAGADLGPDAPPPDSCVPVVTSCGELCGPVFDKCGTTYQCGGCEGGKVCDLNTNQCIDPLVTCEDFDAECGEVRTSCGDRIPCGTCAQSDQECDPDSNKCVDCQELTCAELGFECGNAWLGCGPTSNTTNCGTCGEGLRCNQALNICEPECTARSTQQICEEARLSQGVECGVISNGCGQMVDCGGCPDGLLCGVRGIANRCSRKELPECEAQNRECGEITSVCSGLRINCGECVGTEVCNANGRCGAPCTPKTCDSPEYAGRCGQGLDDGCHGTIDCGCETFFACDTGDPGVVGACVDVITCGTYTDRLAGSPRGTLGSLCSNGASPAFPQGHGLEPNSCVCKDSGAICVDENTRRVVSGPNVGRCCINDSPSCSQTNACSVTNSCTNQTTNCCSGSQFCNSSNQCEDRDDCSAFTERRHGDNCSTSPHPAFPRGDGVNLTCNCRSGGVCQGQTASTPGTCCFNQNSCSGNQCTTTNSCTGATINCCASNQFCNSSNECEDRNTCSDFTNRRHGDDCSTSAHPAFPRGDGQNLNCRCRSGGVCQNETSSSPGTCCFNQNSCSSTNACTISHSCTGATINCCGGNEFCNGSNRCESYKSCSSDYGANGAIGSPCGTFDRGNNQDLNCGCSTSGGRSGNRCVISSGQTGTCLCTPRNCNGDCTLNGAWNNCGARLNCACTGNDVCNPTSKTCVPRMSCSSHGANGNEGDPCGSFPVGDGSSVNCGCSTANFWTNNTCNSSTGRCECIKDECDGRTGTPRDGCGGFLNCGG